MMLHTRRMTTRYSLCSASVAVLLFLLALRESAASSSTASSTTFSSSSASSANRPDFVSHVDRNTLQAALQVAKERHQRMVQKALTDYDTDSVVLSDENDNDDADRLAVQNARFDKYEIRAPGVLPDFADQLERAVHVSNPPLFSKDECANVIQMAEDHMNGQEWGRLDSGQYQISGVWIKDVPTLRAWFSRTVRRRVFPLLQQLYPGFVDDPADLCVDSAYLFKYTPETGRRTDVHIDCGCLSMTIALNDHDEYEGGGTFFEGLVKNKDINDANKKDGVDNEDDRILKMNAGQITLRPGGVRHAGCAIEKGTRYIIGGFCMNRKRVEHLRMLISKDEAKAADNNNNPIVSADEDTDATKRWLEAAIVLNPQWDYPYNLLADHYVTKATDNDKKRAQNILEYALTNVHPGSAELAYPLASLYLEQHEYTRVKDCAHVCLRMDDYDIDALTILAEAQQGLGETTEAEQSYQRIVGAAAASDKAVASAYCNLGVLHQGQEVELEYYEKSLKRLPPTPEEPNFAAQNNLAVAYATRKQWEPAAKYFRGAADLTRCASEKEDAVTALYKVARHIVQDEAAAGKVSATDRPVVEARFVEIMGKGNYEAIVAMAQKAQAQAQAQR